jgi:hypothetical protein
MRLLSSGSLTSDQSSLPFGLLLDFEEPDLLDFGLEDLLVCLSDRLDILESETAVSVSDPESESCSRGPGSECAD